jgi:hypothetical protein
MVDEAMSIKLGGARTFKLLNTDYEPTEAEIEVLADMIPKRDITKWRKRNKYLATKPIPTTLFPTIAKLMIEDGLSFVMDDEGYTWYHEKYRVNATAIREVWGMTSHQWRRFQRWCYKHWPI